MGLEMTSGSCSSSHTSRDLCNIVMAGLIEVCWTQSSIKEAGSGRLLMLCCQQLGHDKLKEENDLPTSNQAGDNSQIANTVLSERPIERK